jgi:hypothetical protein
VSLLHYQVEVTLIVILNTGYGINITSLVNSTSVTATYTVRAGDFTNDLDNINANYLVIGSLQDVGANDLNVDVSLTDRLFNSSSITIDATYPNLSFISSGTFNTSSVVSYTADKDNLNVYIVKSTDTYSSVASITSLADNLYNVASSTLSTATQTIDLTGLDSGNYVLYGVDSNGNFSSSSANSIDIDATVPEFTVLSASPIKNTENLEFSVTENGVVHLIPAATDVTVDNLLASSVASVTYSVASLPSSFTLSSIIDGSYYLYLADQGGNIGQSSTTITIDSTPGTAILTNTGYQKNGDILSMSASESGTLYLLAQTISLTTAVSSPTHYAGSFNSIEYGYGDSTTVTHTISSLSDGIYNLYLIDPAGNHSAASANSITVDTTAPTPTITSTISPSYTNSQNISVQSSEPGTGYLVMGSITDLTANNITSLLTSSPTLIKEIAINAADTDVTVSLTNLEAGSFSFYVKDQAGNLSAAATATILIDTTGPSVIAISSSTPNGFYSQGDTVELEIYLNEKATISGNLEVTFDTGESIQISTGTATDVLRASYTIGAGVDSQDLNTTSLSLPSGATLTDQAGNSATASLSIAEAFNLASGKSIVVDNTSPTVTLTSSDSDLFVRGTDTVTLTATFNEPVNTPTITIGQDIVIAVSMTASSSTNSTTWIYSWSVSDTLNATVTAAVSTTDIAGNLYSGVESLTFVVDNVSPTITSLVADDTELNGSETTTLTITLSEDSTSFTEEDISLTASGTLSNFTATSSTVYTVLYTTTATTTTETVTIAVGVFTDIAGNTNIASSTTISIDTATPTIETFTKVGDTAGYVSPSTVVTLTADFSESMAVAPTITIDDGSATTSATMTVSTTADIWTYSWTAPDITGVVTFTLSGEDLKGNPYTGTESVVINVDNSNPTIDSLTDTDEDNIVRGTDTVTLTATFSEPVVAPTLTIGTDVSNAALTVSPSTSSRTWYYQWTAPTGADGSYTVTLTTTDLLGNAYTGTDSITFEVDSVSPTITSLVADDTELNGSETTTLTITLSEDSTSFTEEDISLTASGTLSNFTATSSKVYTVLYTPTTTATTTTETITIAAAVFTDIAGNTNVSSSTVLTIDTEAPYITLVTAPVSNTYIVGETVSFTLVFNESVEVDTTSSSPTVSMTLSATAQISQL